MRAAQNRQIVAEAFGVRAARYRVLINSLTDNMVWTNHPAAEPASDALRRQVGDLRLLRTPYARQLDVNR